MQAWSWVLTAVGIAALYFAGSGRALGWAIGLGAQVLWVVYAITTHQLGFVASAFAYGFVYGRNWLRWAQQQANREQEEESQ
jgi:hypothetical protein